MGQEAACHVSLETADGFQEADGKALLETSELIFRGALRLKVPFRDVEDVRDGGGDLTVTWPGGRATFALGRYAAAWAEKIRNPRGLLDKLGVKSGQRLRVLGVEDEAFLALLAARGVTLSPADTGNNDFIFFGADDPADLESLPGLRSSIKDAGAIWVVSLKGRGARIRDVDVIEAAKRAGLVDVKVASFSDTHTALKLVIPVAARSRRPTAQGRS